MKMKFIYAAGALLLLSACGGKSGSGADSTATADSVAQTEVAEEAAEQPVTDLVALDAHGDIERLVETVKENLYESSSTFLFDAEGHLVAINGDKVGMERDDKGLPTRLTMEIEDEVEGPMTSHVSFLYDDHNRLTTEKHEDAESSYTVVYTRDESGRQTGMTISDPFGGKEVYTFIYPENSTDEQGNWTTRQQKNGDVTSTVTRTITYRTR